MNEAIQNALGVIYTATRDPNRSIGPQTIMEWPDHVRRLHESVRMFVQVEARLRKAGENDMTTPTTIAITLTPEQADAVRTWWSPGPPPEHAMTAAESIALQALEEAIVDTLPAGEA